MLALEVPALHVREGEADWQLCLAASRGNKFLQRQYEWKRGKTVESGKAVGVLSLSPRRIEIKSDTETLFRKESQQREKTHYIYILYPLCSISLLSQREIDTKRIFSKGDVSPSLSAGGLRNLWIELTQAGISSSLFNFPPLCLLMSLYSSSSAFTPCLKYSIIAFSRPDFHTKYASLPSAGEPAARAWHRSGYHRATGSCTLTVQPPVS